MSRVILLWMCTTVFQFASCLPSTPPHISSEDLLTKSNTIAEGKDSVTRTALELPKINNESSARKRLAAIIDESDAKHLKFLLQGSNKIAKALLTDPRINNAYYAALQTDKVLLEEYVKDSDAALMPHSEKCIKRVLKEFYTIINRHTQKKENRTVENDIVFEALKSNGYEQFEADETKLLNDIGSHYADEFEKYLKSLSPADREKEKDLVYVFETNLENPGVMDRPNYGFRYRMFFADSGN